MLKFYDYAIVFQEFPDEVSLCVNISQCPGTCKNCSEPWLREDIGEELTSEKIDILIKKHSDITLFGLMGGDIDHKDVVRIADYIHSNYENIKVGMYSGMDALDTSLLNCLDYYKIGHWITPDEKHKNCGPLQFPNSNQLMFKKVFDNSLKNEVWLNITSKFRTSPIGDSNKYIILSSRSSPQ